jgi:peptide/nickel transport system substrate-binding protein
MRTTRFAALALAGVLTATGLAACGENPGKTGNGTGKAAATVLNIGNPAGPQTENFNPFVSTSTAAVMGSKFMIYEPLAMWNAVKPADPAKPWLATKFEWSENFTKVALTIRDGVTFSDGKPMTADDVVYSFQMQKDKPELNTNALPFKEITAAGNVVTLTFGKSQFVNQTKILSTVIVPKHIWSTIKDPSKDTVKNPIGTGPYTLKSFTPQTTTLVVRETGYWQTAPVVKELRYTTYTDNNAQTTALANGESEWSFVFVPNYKAVYVDKDPKNHKIYFPPVLAIHGLWINNEKAPFNDPALRRAMNKAINRDDVFMQGEAGYFYPKVQSNTGIPTPAGDAFIAPELKGDLHKVDVEGAKADLTAAGYTFKGDVLNDKSGKPVTMKLSVPAGWSDYVTNVEIAKDNLSKIGIKVTVDKANQDAWFKNVDEGQFDGIWHWSNSGATPYDMYQSMMDGKIYQPIGKASPAGNWGRFKNDEATKLLDEYANAADDTTRTAALHKLQKIFVEQMPVIPTSASNMGGLYSTKNWVGWPDDTNPYAPGQINQPNVVDIVLHLKPATS